MTKNIPVEEVCSKWLPPSLQKQRLERVIREELTEIQQETLLSYYIQGMTLDQIARERGVTRSTVCRNLKRAVQRLRRFLRY